MNIGQSFSTAWTYEGKKTICKITYFFQIAKEDSEELYTKQFSAKGISVCSPTDKYDKEFGKALASARARQKIERKLEKELIRYSYKNSRKQNENANFKFGNSSFGFVWQSYLKPEQTLLSIGNKVYKLTEVKS